MRASVTKCLNLKCVNRCAFQCIKSMKMGFCEEQKSLKSEIWLKSELLHPCLWFLEASRNVSFFANFWKTRWFQTKHSQLRLLEFIKLYKQNLVENILIFIIYQDYNHWQISCRLDTFCTMPVACSILASKLSMQKLLTWQACAKPASVPLVLPTCIPFCTRL